MGADGFTFPYEYRRAYPNRHNAGAHSDSRSHAHDEACADCDGDTKPNSTHTGPCAHVDAGADTNRRSHCSAHTDPKAAH